jgi:hypothetical protein
VWTTRDRVAGPFFFVEWNITGDIYLELLEQFVFPQVDDIERENSTGVVFNKTAPRLISVYRFALLWMPGFQIGGLEEVDQ